MGSYVILDLEMCRVKKKDKKDRVPIKNELIQIGAVLLDESFTVVDSFESFVCPQMGKIDSYIEKLTGIKQSDVENAPLAEEALSKFEEWLPEDAVMVSWSMTDKAQLEKETQVKGLAVSKLLPYFETWIDSQQEFGERLQSPKTYSLSEALLIAGIDYSEGAHNALVDAKNTAMLFAQTHSGKEMTLSSYYIPESTATKGTFCPFAGLFDGINFAS